MDKKDYFFTISDIHFEGCLELPIDELESFENTANLRHLKFQAFKAKKTIYKAEQDSLLHKTNQKIQEKIKQLIDLPVESLQEMLLKLSPNMHFRNFEKLDKDELIRILEDHILLDNLDDDNE